MSRYSYPYTIENGGTERLTFHRRVPGRLGDRLEGESSVVVPGAGPPMHVHHRQEEGFTVVAGRIGYQRLGEPARFAGPGESVVFAAGEVHRFWNAGDSELRCTAWVEPVENFEYFINAIFDSSKRNGNPAPHPLDAAFLTRRYRTEFTMHVVPIAVQRLVFPLLVAVGRLLGRYARYADAPEPLRS